MLGVRVVAVDGDTAIARDILLAGRAELIVYAAMSTGCRAARASRTATRTHQALSRRLRSLLHRGRHHPPRLNPILFRLALAALVVFLVGTWYFHAAFKGAWLDRRLFRGRDDDDDRLRRSDPRPKQPRRHRDGHGADAGGHDHHRPLHRLCRLAADPGAMGQHAGSAPDASSRAHRRVRCRQHRQRGDRSVARASASRLWSSSRSPRYGHRRKGARATRFDC